MDEKEINGIVAKGEYHETIQWDLEGFRCYRCSFHEACDCIVARTLSNISLCEYITDSKSSVFVDRGKVKIEKALKLCH